MSEKSLSQILSDFVYRLEIQDVPKEVIEKAKIHLLDTVGIMLAMHNSEEIARLVKIVKRLGGPPESSVVGHGFKVAVANAVIANAAMAHSADYDDTHLAPILHPSCVAVPTALAVGELIEAPGERFIESIVSSYEVSIRLGLATLRRLHDRGFHPTSVLGVFGAVTASAKLLGLKPEDISSAFGIAGSMSSGILQGHREGVWLKPLHPAIASHNGIIATLMALEGLKGPTKIFEGEWGFYKAYIWGEKPYLDAVVKDLGKSWETLDISIKPYPVGHAAVAPIDLAVLFKEKYGLKPEDLRSVTIYLPKTAVDLVCKPWEHRIKPRTPYEAKFSVPYLFIAGLRNGWVGLWDFTWDSIRNKDIIMHTSKVRCTYESSYDEYVERAVIPAKAKILTVDGRTYEEEVINHRGSPGNPIAWSDAIKKFINNISYAMFKDRGEAIIEIIKHIEKHRVNDLVEMLVQKTI